MQRRRPRPVAETGRSCWGSGLQDASAVQGTKQTQGAATRRLPRLESSGDLAALNTRHLLRKPVCGLKAPLGLSCPAGTAVLSGSLLARKREHTRRRCILQKASNFKHATTLCAGSIPRIIKISLYTAQTAGAASARWSGAQLPVPAGQPGPGP